MGRGMNDHEDGFEMLVPIVAGTSEGGPFDDASFVAGFEMGRFWQTCASMQGLVGQTSGRVTIHRNNKPQADLIAMHFDMGCVEESCGDEYELAHPDSVEWCSIRFGYDLS